MLPDVHMLHNVLGTTWWQVKLHSIQFCPCFHNDERFPKDLKKKSKGLCKGLKSQLSRESKSKHKIDNIHISEAEEIIWSDKLWQIQNSCKYYK